MPTARIFSFGGGVQSTAVLVLQAQEKLAEPYNAFVFSNVGADSENPATLEYIEKHAKPFAEAHGIRFVEVAKRDRKGDPVTLMDAIMSDNRSVPIPARMSNGAPGNRTCTTDFKIRVVDRWICEQSWERVVVGIGISMDEMHRMRDQEWHDTESVASKRPRKLGFFKKREYPLIDLRLSRAQCHALIAEAGLPTPPKSSCFFCPFMRRNEWIALKRDSPELFEEAVQVEKFINAKRGVSEKDSVYSIPRVSRLSRQWATRCRCRSRTTIAVTRGTAGRRKGNDMPKGVPKRRICEVEGCDRPCARLGPGRGHQITVCVFHYRQRRRAQIEGAHAPEKGNDALLHVAIGAQHPVK